MVNGFYFNFGGLERALERVFEDYMDDLERDLKKYIAERVLPMAIGEHKAVAASNEDWVSRVVGRDYTRPALAYMRVRKGVIEATNGHLLLRAKTSLSDGFYLPNNGVIAKSEDVVAYPNTDKAVPEYNNYEPLIATVKGAIMQVNGGSLVDSQYLSTIIEGNEKEWEIAFDVGSTIRPLMLRRNDGQRWAALMPVRE